ncbi:hypothetical protein NPIL_76411, partial [Nephila pilipes]
MVTRDIEQKNSEMGDLDLVLLIHLEEEQSSKNKNNRLE